MAFTKRIIKDRVTIGGRRYTLTPIGDGRYEIVPSPDSVVEIGTSLDAELFQRYEDYLWELDQELPNILNHVDDTENPHSVTKSQIGLPNVPNVDATDADNILTGTLAAERVAQLPQTKITNLVTDLGEKQAKSPLDNKRYMLYNGSIEEFNPPAGTYVETLIATLEDNDTVLLSTLQSYDLIRIELDVKELTAASSLTIDLVTHTFKPSDFVRKGYLGVKQWQSTNESGWLGGNSIFDGVYDFGGVYETLIAYLQTNYPASGQSVGDVARGHDGTLPTIYEYARVVQNTTYRDVRYAILDGNFKTAGATTAIFNAPSLTNGVYQLKIYGINY
jgi:hypothetical protein